MRCAGRRARLTASLVAIPRGAASTLRLHVPFVRLLVSLPSAALTRRPPPSVPFVRSLVSVPSAALPRRPPLSVPGQELFKRFVDGNNIKNEARAVEWFRALEKDEFAAQLIILHEGSLELEALGDSLQVGQKSSNGLVEHLGERVFVEKSTFGIDNDSEISPHTITRFDQREAARLSLDIVDNPKKMRKVTVVGQAGIGKTRGGLAYTLQELLWRGEAVMRVGYKDRKTYLFLPDEDGAYKVWETVSSEWPRSRLAGDKRTYALIDPPEKEEYIDSAGCHVIKWASNNASKHYWNWDKDGSLLLTAMPTEAEVLVMIPYLWTDRTPFPGQRFDTAEAKAEEIMKRCHLVGWLLRIAFDYKRFQAHLLKVVAESKTLGMKMDIALVKSYYEGRMTTADGEASSLSSKMYLMGPMPGDVSHETMFANLNPLAAFVLRARLMEKIANLDDKRAFEYEDFVSMMFVGGTAGGVEFPPRFRITTTSHAETAQLVRALTETDNQFVVAHTGFPVFDVATSIHNWFNAKVGTSTPTVGSGVFVTLMTKHLSLARVVCDDLQWVKGMKSKITLTFVRNNPATKFNFKDDSGSNQSSMDFKKVEAFFHEHVKVKFIDVSNLTPLPGHERALMERTSNLVGEYERLIDQKLLWA